MENGHKAENLSHEGTVYTEGRDNMNLRKWKLDTDGGVFANKRESIKSDAIKVEKLYMRRMHRRRSHGDVRL